MDTDRLKHYRHYRELKQELGISGNSGIFPVLCPTGKAAETVFNCLKNDLTEARYREIDLSEGREDMAAFFERQLTDASENGKLFLITGLEKAPETVAFDFMGYMQSLRERHRSTLQALVISISPAFEGKLFKAAPEMYRQVSGVYDFSPLFPPETPQERARRTHQKTDFIPFDNIRTYLERVIRQYESWKTLWRRNESFLIPEMGEANLSHGYLPSYFTAADDRRHLLDDMLRVFLENPAVNFMSLIGETGTGKTAFALHYFIETARNYLKRPDEDRIPVFLSISGTDGILDVEALLIREFEKAFHVKLNRLKIQDMLLHGKFVFILDGFDEMTACRDFHITLTNLENIAKLSLKNIILDDGVEKTRPANKVFMTCAIHYFQYDIGENEEDGVQTDLFRDFEGKENYQIVRLDRREYDDSQLRGVIVNGVRNPIAVRNLMAVINDVYALNKLSSPKVLREMIVRTLRWCREKREVNLADLYEAYAGIWIQRDDWRYKITPAGKRAFLHQLAITMFHKGSGFFIPAEDMEPPPREAIKEEFRDDEGINYRNEIRTCEFVIHNADANYRFVHRSFMDFFIADSYVQHIREKRNPPIDYSSLEEEVRAFIKLILSSGKADLKNLDLSGLDLKGVNFYHGELSGARMNKADLEGAILMNALLKDADLTATNLTGCKMTRTQFVNADLSGVNLQHARLREADLSGAKLNGANLQGADLRGAVMRRTRLAWSDLRGADLTGADLTGAFITDADLIGTRLQKAVLNEADLSGSNLNRCRAAEAEMISVKMANADLSEAVLTGANLKWAVLTGANFSLADLNQARLREADLTRAVLDAAKCRGADLRLAKMSGIKLRDANLNEADLTEADLTKAKLAGADLGWANFTRAGLEGADLREASLNMAKLREADLKGGNLSAADITWGDLTGADLEGADLTGANLSEADLTRARLVKAKLDRANLKGASLTRADIRGASLKDARMEAAEMTDVIR